MAPREWTKRGRKLLVAGKGADKTCQASECAGKKDREGRRKGCGNVGHGVKEGTDKTLDAFK